MARKETEAAQRFVCDQAGCTKSYSRVDHLMRHKLNHDTRAEDLLRCEQCGKTFVRHDLLTRHIERHMTHGQALGRWADSSLGVSKKKRQQPKVEAEGDDEDSDQSQEEEASSSAAARGAKAPVTAVATCSSSNRTPLPPVKRARLSGPSSTISQPAAALHEWDTSQQQRYPQTAPQQALYPSAGNPADAAAAASGQQWRYWAPGTLMPGSTPSTTLHAHGPLPMVECWRIAALAPPPANSQSNAAVWMPQDFAPPPPVPHAPHGNDMFAAVAASSAVVPYWKEQDAHAATTAHMAMLPSDTVRGQLQQQHGAYPGDVEVMSTSGSVHSMAHARSSACGSVAAASAVPVDMNGRHVYSNGAASMASSSAVRPVVLPSTGSPGASFSGPTGPDAYPFAAPPPDHSAEYGWLLDGADPFAELSSSEAESRRHSSTATGAVGGFVDPGTAMLVETAAQKAEEQRDKEHATGVTGHTEKIAGVDLNLGQMSPTGLFAEAATRMMQGSNSEELSPFKVIEHTTPDAVGNGTDSEAALTGKSERDGMQCDGIDTIAQPGPATAQGGESNTFDALLHFGTSDPRQDIDETQQETEERKGWFCELEATLPHEECTFVTEATRRRLLRFLSTIPELPQAPLFTPRAISCYLFLFFSKYNYIYPLIHRPSFVAQHADAMLLSAMIVIGAHFADLPNHVLGVRIGSKLWGAYFSLDDFLPARATLSMLQAMLLTEAFGKLMATRPQHETCHLMHGAVVTLARRNACFHISSKAQWPGEPGSQEHWLAWVREEEKKRIALFCFVLDAQHATLFRHTPALSAFQIQLQLPCDDKEWQQTTAADWFAVHSSATAKREPPFFIAALKACMTRGGKSPPVGGTFSRFILFHGLLSVAYDLQWKRHTLIDPLRACDWREKLSASFASWKTRLDAACAQPTASLTAQAIFKASSSLVVWSQIVLVTDTVDIQIYAGLPSVLGRFIDRSTFTTARNNVKEWAGRADGRVAVWYAAHFLRATLLGNGSVAFVTKTASSNPALEHLERAVGPRRPNDVALYELIHHQWIMYLCTLVIWAYGKALEPVRSTDLLGSGTSSTGAKPRAEAEISYVNLPDAQDVRRAAAEYLDAMATPTPEDIADVTHTACQTMGVLALVEQSLRASSTRWELLDEGADVLRKLIKPSDALGHAGEGLKAREER